MAVREKEETLHERIRNGDTYVLLFLMLLVSYVVVVVFADESWGRTVTIAVYGLTLLLASRASRVRVRAFRIAAGLVAVAFLTSLAATVADLSLEGVGGFTLIGLLQAVAVVVIGRRLLLHPSVNVETVAGALCIYLLIGMVFGSFYAIADDVTPDSLVTSSGADIEHNVSNSYYFSYVALTTTGFGDIVGGTELARSMSVIEAVVGNVFLATLVAMLIAGWAPTRNRLPRLREEDEEEPLNKQ